MYYETDLLETFAEECVEKLDDSMIEYFKMHIDYTVFVGYPTWWADMPMILYSFLESHDLADKTVIPFNTHGGSGFAGTIDAIKKIQVNANVLENGFSVSRDDAENAKEDVIKWLKELEYVKE